MKIDSAVWSGLRVFHFVATELSFTAAGKCLNVTTGAVSQQIKQLESRLGYPLFQRTTRRLSLTDDGRRLLDAVSPAYLSVDEQLQRISSSRCSGPVRLIAAHSFTLQWLVPRLGSFYRRYPGIELRVNADADIISARPDSYDLAVDFARHQLADQQTPSRVLLMGERLVPVCAPDLLAQEPLQAERLRRYTLLHDSNPWPGAGPYEEWNLWLADAGLPAVEGPNQICFNRSDLAVQAAQQGQGIALGRLALVADKLLSGELSIAFGQPLPSPAGYYLYGASTPSCQESLPSDPASDGQDQQSRINALKDWLIEHCKVGGNG